MKNLQEIFQSIIELANLQNANINDLQDRVKILEAENAENTRLIAMLMTEAR